MGKKIRYLLSTNLQMMAAYQGDIVIYTLSSFVLPLVMMAVWLAVASSSPTLTNDKTYIVSYFFLQIVIVRITGVWHGIFMGADIREGRLSQYLLKPFPYIWYQVADNISEKVWKLIISLPALAIIGYLLRDNLVLQISHVPIFIVSIVGAAVMNFLIEHIIGISAFWFSNVGVLQSYNEMIQYVLSGKLFPLSYMKGVIPLGIISFLPYKYTIGFPIDIVLGKVQGKELFTGMLTELWWVVAFYMLYTVLWKKGLQTYGAYGG